MTVRLGTASPVRCFDAASAALALVTLAPVLAWLAVRARLRFGRVLDRERVSGRSGEAVQILRFAGLQRGRDLPLMLNVLRGELGWVGPAPVSLDTDSEQCVDALGRGRPGLLCRQRLQRLTGTCYETETGSADESLSGLRSNLALVMRYLIARTMAPHYDSRRPAQLRLLGVRIDNVTMDDALERIDVAVGERVPALMGFVNPDCLNKVVTDTAYASALESLDGVFADGIGLQIASRMLGYQLHANVNGTDLFPLLCERAARNGQSLYLLGGQAGVAQRMVDAMRARFPTLRWAGIQHGYFDANELPAVRRRIHEARPDILLVGFGAPRQEMWMVEHVPGLDVGVAIGVGGLFDFYSGSVSRAPRWLRDVGLEWTWRFLQEPRRMWRRYVIGNPLFLHHVWRQSRQESGRQAIKRFSGGPRSLDRAAWRATTKRTLYTLVLSGAYVAQRLLDVIVASSALLILSPLLLTVAICIRRESPGPVFFAQERVGKWGEYFTMYKFRSMCTDAEHLKKALEQDNEMDGGVLFKMKEDPRTTRTGRFIRKYSIDELPQLWNVLKGDMALVGPRPPVKAEVDQYRLSDRRRLEIKPGITCLWQVSGRSEIPFDEQVELDVNYIESHGIVQNVKILLRTIPAVMLGKGAY